MILYMKGETLPWVLLLLERTYLQETEGISETTKKLYVLRDAFTDKFTHSHYLFSALNIDIWRGLARFGFFFLELDMNPHWKPN